MMRCNAGGVDDIHTYGVMRYNVFDVDDIHTYGVMICKTTS